MNVINSVPGPVTPEKIITCRLIGEQPNDHAFFVFFADSKYPVDVGKTISGESMPWAIYYPRLKGVSSKARFKVIDVRRVNKLFKRDLARVSRVNLENYVFRGLHLLGYVYCGVEKKADRRVAVLHQFYPKVAFESLGEKKGRFKSRVNRSLCRSTGLGRFVGVILVSHLLEKYSARGTPITHVASSCAASPAFRESLAKAGLRQEEEHFGIIAPAREWIGNNRTRLIRTYRTRLRHTKRFSGVIGKIRGQARILRRP